MSHAIMNRIMKELFIFSKIINEPRISQPDENNAPEARVGSKRATTEYFDEEPYQIQKEGPNDLSKQTNRIEWYRGRCCIHCVYG